MSKTKSKSKPVPEGRPVAQNRKARHDYEILDTFEAGIALQGSEVKSIRSGKAQIRDAYARIEDGEIWVHMVHIPPYEQAVGFGAHNPDRPKKLLMHRMEIERLKGKSQHGSLSLVPLSIYFKGGKAKMELALAKGRKTYDKRHELAARDAERDLRRASAHLGIQIH